MRRSLSSSSIANENGIDIDIDSYHRYHLGCFVDWIESGKERVCEALADRSLVLGTDKNKEMNELLEWDDLIVSMILCMLCVSCLMPNVYCVFFHNVSKSSSCCIIFHIILTQAEQYQYT